MSFDADQYHRLYEALIRQFHRTWFHAVLGLIAVLLGLWSATWLWAVLVGFVFLGLFVQVLRLIRVYRKIQRFFDE